MIPLALATLFSAGFGLTVRFAQRRGCHLIAVGAINYTTAALVHLAVSLALGWTRIHGQTILIGGLGGLAFVTAYCILFSFMSLRGLPVAAMVTQLSVLVPIGFSLILWGEKTETLQAIGGGFALLALPFLSLQPGRKNKLKARDFSVLLLFLLFLVNGFCLLSVRWYHQTGIAGEESVFFFFLFGFSAAVAWLVWFLTQRSSSLKDLLPGIVLGICNSVGNRLVIASLRTLPSMVVYPFFSAGALVFTIIFSLLVWKEKIARLETAGVILTFAAIVLINLSR